MACYPYDPPPPHHFDFEYLWNTTQQTISHCPNSTKLETNDKTKLNLAACMLAAGETSSWTSWTPYPAYDVWSRLTNWKFPLLQLVIQFPRPPLGSFTEAFALIHLIGDPIDSIASLLYTLAVCESRARFWKRVCEKSRQPILGGRPEQDWKIFTLVMVSYDEGNYGDQALKVLERSMKVLKRSIELNHHPAHPDATREEQIERLSNLYKTTAGALASDRSTKFLPILVAQGIFISSVAIAFAKTMAAKPGPSNYINIEAHSIAFSAIYFWIIPAVFLSSVIGVSQSETAIPRILDLFRERIKSLSNEIKSLPDESAPNNTLEADTLPTGDNLRTTGLRTEKGGVYSWQSGHWHMPHYMRIGRTVEVTPDGRFKARIYILAFFMVISGTFTGIWISARVPPDGIDCRHLGQGSILTVWVFNFFLDFPLKSRPHHQRFLLVFLKDLLAAILTVFAIIITQAGIFNRCSCSTKFGRVGLTLPQDHRTLVSLEHRIRREYPCIAFGSIIMQLTIFGAVWWKFRHAFQVFLQRDDGTSNLDFRCKTKPSYWWPKVLCGPRKRRNNSVQSIELQHLFPGGEDPPNENVNPLPPPIAH